MRESTKIIGEENRADEKEEIYSKMTHQLFIRSGEFRIDIIADWNDLCKEQLWFS